MLKKDELADPNSCLNRSRDDEPLFVLCGRDRHAPDAIAYWTYLKAGGKPLDFTMPAIPDAVLPKVESAFADAMQFDCWRQDQSATTGPDFNQEVNRHADEIASRSEARTRRRSNASKSSTNP